MAEYGVHPDGYRLPAATHVGTVRLKVSDLDRSLEFYEGLLGMHVRSRDTDMVQLGATAGEPLLELVPGAEPRTSGRGRLGLFHFAVLLPDRASLGRLLGHLLRARVQPGAADHLVSEALYLQDPDDLGIELYRDRPRGEWKTRGDEIAMASDPLDRAGLLAEGNGSAWTGMPAGTTIGHVHLHVASIAAARSFYHDALGFDVVVSSYPGALFMSAGGYHHHLGVNTWAGPHAVTPAAHEPRLLSWDIVLPTTADTAAAAQSLTGAGHTVAPDEGGSITLDPWNTALRLVAERNTNPGAGA
jgi:catechol 2,3-dioxygenase